MKQAAAIISLLMALILLGAALAGFIDDNRGADERMRAGFAALNRQDDAALYRQFAEHDEAQHMTAIESIGGVVFLIAGFALWGKKRESDPQQADA